MPAVVSDSSPIVYLTRSGRFELLSTIFGEVFIPLAVWTEVGIHGSNRPEGIALKQAISAGWISIEDVSSEPTPAGVGRLDEGERQAIILAAKKRAILVIDESDGREAATMMGIQCVGTLGVLVEAKHRGLIKSVRAEVDRLRDESNFRFSETLLQYVLALAGEDER